MTRGHEPLSDDRERQEFVGEWLEERQDWIFARVPLVASSLNLIILVLYPIVARHSVWEGVAIHSVAGVVLAVGAWRGQNRARVFRGYVTALALPFVAAYAWRLHDTIASGIQDGVMPTALALLVVLAIVNYLPSSRAFVTASALLSVLTAALAWAPRAGWEAWTAVVAALVAGAWLGQRERFRRLVSLAELEYEKRRLRERREIVEAESAANLKTDVARAFSSGGDASRGRWIEVAPLDERENGFRDAAAGADGADFVFAASAPVRPELTLSVARALWLDAKLRGRVDAEAFVAGLASALKHMDGAGPLSLGIALLRWTPTEVVSWSGVLGSGAATDLERRSIDPGAELTLSVPGGASVTVRRMGASS